MSLLAAWTVKVSAILLVVLAGALCLRTRSAAARRWVLAVGVASACAAPALHVLPVPPVVRVAPLGALDWSAGPVFDMLGLRPYALFTADADVLGPAVASESAAFRPGRSGRAVAAVAGGHVVGLLAVTIWLAGTVAGAGVLLVGLARLRWIRASSSLVTDGPWHRLCADLARSCGLRRGVDLLFGPRPGLVATWGWRRPAVMLPAAASEWSAERMRVVLLHELAHVRHCDWLLQVGAQTARISGAVVDQDGNVVRNPDITFTIREAWQSAGPMRYAFVDQDGNVVRNPDVTRISTTRSASAQSTRRARWATSRYCVPCRSSKRRRSPRSSSGGTSPL